MDVDATTAGMVQQAPESPVETLSEIGSKKHRMQTGKENDVFTSRYQLLEQVGSGASGTVWKCSLAAGEGVGAEDDPVPGKVYAAKIIDLRPFKLRERFSMQRLMREVDIMQRLRHPNIIRLVEALDTPEQLVLVLEYAPGVELFDAILSKKKFSEDEARPVFVQVARALQYMHSKQIVHRDVKPENVMIIDRRTEDGLYPEAKLLDFGLSKAIDADTGGSVARTFVGTPSYLAPEVEEKQGGRGKPYGTPVDCWSLGAMLYVMLVARFPEFQLQGARKHVRMVGPLWDNVSAEAKELIRSLMAFDAGARLKVDQALRHPWLGDLAAKEPPPSPLQQPTLPTGMGTMPPLPETLSFSVPPAVMAAGAAPGGAFNSPGSQPRQQRGGGGGGAWGGRPPVVTEQQTPPATSTKKSFEFTPTGPTIRELGADESPLSSLDHGLGEKIPDHGHQNTTTTTNDNNDSNSNSGDNMQVERPTSGRIGMGMGMGMQMVNMRDTVGAGLMGTPTEGNVPLLQLQDRITQCLETAVTTYTDYPEGAASLRRSAALCRESLRESVTLLRKIEKTAAQVISLFPDLTLAVEEGEPDLAHDFFSTVKTWVQEMYTAVNVVQAHNSANALEVGEAMKQHAETGAEGQRQQEELERQQQEELQRQRRQQQRQKREKSSSNIGGTAYVAKGSGQASNGAPVGREAGAADGKGDQFIAVDPETFEVVRQIQELRKNLGKQTAASAPAAPAPTTAPTPMTSAGSSTATATASPGTTAAAVAADGSQATATADEHSTANAIASDGSHASASAVDGRDARAVASDGTAAAVASGATPADTLSDEKLINLFLLMAGRNPNWPGGGGAGGGAGASGGSDISGGGGNEQSTGATQGGRGRGRGGGGGAGSEDGQDPDVEVVSGLTAQMSIDGGIDAPNTIEEQQFAAGSSADGSSDEWGGETQLARLDQQKTDVYAEVRRALQMLHEVDSVLEQLAIFWANSEVIFDVLLRKGDLVEKFVSFANKPRLLQRFRERLADYKRFWEGVQNVCNKYVCGQHKCGEPRPPSATPAPPGGVGGGVNGINDGGGGRGGRDFDGSFSASSHRTDSNNSAGSQGEREREGEGPGQAAKHKHGLGGAGGWATMEAGMDVGHGVGGGLR